MENNTHLNCIFLFENLNPIFSAWKTSGLWTNAHEDPRPPEPSIFHIRPLHLLSYVIVMTLSIRGSCRDYYHVFADVLCKVCRADAAAWSVFNKRTRLFHFTPLWSSPLDLCCKMYSGGQRVSCWCERQGEVALFDLIFFFFFSSARLSNSLPCMHDVKQHEYKAMCMWPYSPHLSSLPFPPIKNSPP